MYTSIVYVPNYFHHFAVYLQYNRGHERLLAHTQVVVVLWVPRHTKLQRGRDQCCGVKRKTTKKKDLKHPNLLTTPSPGKQHIDLNDIPGYEIKIKKES